jgi:hypothetical protein
VYIAVQVSVHVTILPFVRCDVNENLMMSVAGLLYLQNCADWGVIRLGTHDQHASQAEPFFQLDPQRQDCLAHTALAAATALNWFLP